MLPPAVANNAFQFTQSFFFVKLDGEGLFTERGKGPCTIMFTLINTLSRPQKNVAFDIVFIQ